MTNHGVIFTNPPIFDKCGNTRMIWTLSVILVRVEALWKEVGLTNPLRTSDWQGWLLVYLTFQCFNEGQRRQHKNDVFKLEYVSKYESLIEKVQIYEELNQYFELNPKVYCRNVRNDDGEELRIIETFRDIPDDTKVAVIYGVAHDKSYNTRYIVEQNIVYELHTIVGTGPTGRPRDQNDENKWDGIVYSRHGGPFYNKWWMSKRKDEVPIQVDNEFYRRLPTNDSYTFVYVRMEDTNVEEIRDEFMKNIGGQTHVKCAEHRCPLIASMTRNHKCACGRKEFFRCCNYKCKAYLCKNCFKTKSVSTTTFVASPEFLAAGGHGNDEGGEDGEDLLDGNDSDGDNDIHETYNTLNVDVHVPESATKIGFLFRVGTTGNVWLSSIVPGTPAYNIHNWNETIVGATVLKYNNEKIKCIQDVLRISRQILELKPITFQVEFATVKKDNEDDDDDDDCDKEYESDSCQDDNSDSDFAFDTDDENNSSEDDSSQDDYDSYEEGDNIDDFLMSTLHEDIDINESDNDSSDGIHIVDPEAYGTEIQTTDAGAYAREIEHETKYGGSFGNIRIAGHVILNQCGSLLTRKKYEVKGSSQHKFFLQKLVATCKNTAVPLMYPEGVLFPSIFWKSSPDNCAIVGAIPAPLLTQASHGSRFCSIQEHV